MTQNGDEVRAQGVTVFPHVVAVQAINTAEVVTVPLAQIAIGADALPGDVAVILMAKHSADWCIRLIDALITKLEVEPDAQRHERIAAAILAGAGALE